MNAAHTSFATAYVLCMRRAVPFLCCFKNLKESVAFAHAETNRKIANKQTSKEKELPSIRMYFRFDR